MTVEWALVAVVAVLAAVTVYAVRAVIRAGEVMASRFELLVNAVLASQPGTAARAASLARANTPVPTVDEVKAQARESIEAMGDRNDRPIIGMNM